MNGDSDIGSSGIIGGAIRNGWSPENERHLLDLAERFDQGLHRIQDHIANPSDEDRECLICRGTLPEIAFPVVLGQFMSRAIRLALPMVDLVRHGWGDSAALLTRCMIDLRLRLDWIAAHDSGARALIHIGMAAEEKVREMRAMHKHGVSFGLTEPERIAQYRDAVHGYHEIRRTLDSQLAAKAADSPTPRKKKNVTIRSLLPSLRQMAEETGQMLLYDFWYGEFSIVEHNNLESLREYVRMDAQEGVSTKIASGPDWGASALACGIEQFCAICERWREEFGVPKSSADREALGVLIADVRNRLVLTGRLCDGARS